MAEGILELNADNFSQEVLQSTTPVLVDFWAIWCGPCRALAPTLETVAKLHTGQVKIGKLNVDDHPELAARYGVRSIPTVILFKNGNHAGQIVGNVPQTAIETLLKS